MKVWILLTLFLSSQVIFLSCENIPRDRPTIAETEQGINQTTDNDDDGQLEIPQRPNGAIIVQADHCGCSEGKPITLGDCAAICSEAQASSDSLDTLFFNVEVTEAISLDDYEDVNGWCKIEIIDPNTNQPVAESPGCVIEVKDEKGVTSQLPFEPNAGRSSFSVDISSLNEDQTYRLSIMEITSGAKSTSFQIRKFSNLIENKLSGPLMLMPVNRYVCMIREFQTEEGSNSTILTDINRFHLFFTSENRPEPLQESSISSFYCHDIETYGTTPINSPLLEETTGVFTVWYNNDPRLFDLDNDGTEDINQLIEQEVSLQGATLTQTPRLFAQLNWISGFDDGDTSPSGDSDSSSVSVENKALGYYMSPFLDEDTFKSYCPTQQHYYSSAPLFRAMRDLIAVDTEGLYVAKEDNVLNFLLINESVLNQIWFYIEAGQHIEPTSDTVSGKQVQFYWPPDPTSPFIKKSHQRVYTVKSTDELSEFSSLNVSNTNAANNGGVRTNFPPHDKRIGCVPVISQ